MADKKPKLHELLAVEADLQNTAKSQMDEVVVAFTKKTEHFRGLLTKLEYFDEARAKENLTEEKVLVTTVSERLKYALRYVGNYYDALLKKEATNQHARADLIVNDQVMATDVPATFLLGMETRLKGLREAILVIPTLDPGLGWTPDASAKLPEIFNAPPQVRNRTEKRVRPVVLYEATDKHPAQVKEVTEDVVVATITAFNTSGMWTPLHKATVIANVDTLIIAVKKARQRANSVEVVGEKIASKMIDFILSV